MQIQRDGESIDQAGEKSMPVLPMKAKKMEQNTALPIGADFNKHSGDFVVVTTNDIRMYCGATG